MKSATATAGRITRGLRLLASAAIVALPLASCGGGGGHSAAFAIEVTPAVSSIADGTSVQMVAMALYPDGTKNDVTSSAVWSSSNAGVAAVSSNLGSKGLAAGLAPGSTNIAARLSGARGAAVLTVTSATLSSIEVTPAVPSIAKSTTLQFTATGVFSDDTTQDLTKQVVWDSSDDLVATVPSTAGSEGLATGVDVGTTTISATFSGVIGTTDLTITNATLTSIQVTPSAPVISTGTSRQMTATGIFSDGTQQDLTTQAAWQSGDLTVAAVSDAAGTKGKVDARNVGLAAISATLLGVSGATPVGVTNATLSTIAVAPSTPSAAKGTQMRFTATGTFSDGTSQDITSQVAWQSSNPAVCALSSAPTREGQALALDVGLATVTATYAGTSGTTRLTVTNATLVSIAVAPSIPTLVTTTRQQFTATGIFSDGSSQDLTDQVTWSSSDGAVAAISDAAGSKGSSIARAAGSTSISAKLLGVTGTTTLSVVDALLDSIVVTPTLPTIANGTAIQFAAIGIFSDGSNQDLSAEVTWTSNDETIATVSNAAGSAGLGSGLAIGTATISAEFAGTVGSTDLSVSAATLASIEVTPTAPTIAKGTSLQLAATGVYTDGSTQDLTTQVSWSCSSATVASISNSGGTQGIAEGAGAGSATISAMFAGVRGSTTLDVSAATLQSIAVEPQDGSIAKGTTMQFHARGTYSDATTQDLTDQVTWTSTDETIATIANAPATPGHAIAVDLGTATISASLGGVTGSTTLTGTNATLVSVDVTPASVSLPLGMTIAFAATATFSDSSVQDVTSQATWISTDTNVATVTNGPVNHGVARANAVATATITATLQGISGNASLSGTNALLQSIAVTPADPTVARGHSIQFVATGTYSDASTLDLTGQVTWSSSDTAIATVSNAAADHGRAVGVGVGHATISAALQGISGSTGLTVDPTVLVSIDLTPLTPRLPKTFKLQFVATGHYSDGTTQNMTTLVTWISSNTTRATISNASGSQGLATGVNTGTSSILFTYPGFSGSTVLTVTNATPVSTTITPSPLTLAVGHTQQMTALTTFNDGSVMDISLQRRWTSSHANRVAVSNTSPTKGLITALSAGTSDITIQVGGPINKAHITVP